MGSQSSLWLRPRQVLHHALLRRTYCAAAVAAVAGGCHRPEPYPLLDARQVRRRHLLDGPPAAEVGPPVLREASLWSEDGRERRSPASRRLFRCRPSRTHLGGEGVDEVGPVAVPPPPPRPVALPLRQARPPNPGPSPAAAAGRRPLAAAAPPPAAAANRQIRIVGRSMALVCCSSTPRFLLFACA